MLATMILTSSRCISRTCEKCTTSHKKRRRETPASAQGMKTQAQGTTRVGPARRRGTRGVITRHFNGGIAKVESSKVGGRRTNNG